MYCYRAVCAARSLDACLESIVPRPRSFIDVLNCRMKNFGPALCSMVHSLATVPPSSAFEHPCVALLNQSLDDEDDRRRGCEGQKCRKGRRRAWLVGSKGSSRTESQTWDAAPWFQGQGEPLYMVFRTTILTGEGIGSSSAGTAHTLPPLPPTSAKAGTSCGNGSHLSTQTRYTNQQYTQYEHFYYSGFRPESLWFHKRFKISVLMGRPQNVTATNQLSVHIQLGYGWPPLEFLDPLPQLFIVQHVSILKINF